MVIGMIPGGKKQYDTEKHSDGSQQRDGSVTLDCQTAHDAELMLWNYLYCMDRGIIPPKEGWVRQAVAETRKKLADATKSASPNVPDQRPGSGASENQ